MDTLRKVRDIAGHHDKVDATETDPNDRALPEITDNIAFNAEAHPDDLDGIRLSKTDKVKGKLKAATHAVAHPQQAAKARGQKQLLKTGLQTERPWLGDQEKADARLFRAYDELDDTRKKDAEKPTDPGTTVHVQDAEDRVQSLEEKRTELEVVWYLSRYVQRARVVRGPLAWPDHSLKERYHKPLPHGKYSDMLWVKWIGHVLLYGLQDASLQYIDPTNTVAYDKEELIRTVERLLVVSQAYQHWWNRVRFVYRWEDRWLTFKWLMVFIVLLKTGYFMSFYWGYLFYSFATNRYGQHSRYWMRVSDDRATQTRERAATLAELIIRHGSDAWLEPFLDTFGPWIQTQILDTAQFLEITNASYMWRNVTSTTYTCFGYFVLFLVSAVPDLQFSTKIFWLACGMYFFASRPIASLYPRFRHVVDPLRWFYWYQPSKTEGAFQWLRERAQLALHNPENDTGDFAVDPNDEGDMEEEQLYFESLSSPPPQYYSVAAEKLELMAAERPILSFPAHWSGRRGRLQVTRRSVRFVVRGRKTNNTEWERSLADLLEVRKLNIPLTDLPAPSLTKLSKSSSALSILWVRQDDTTLVSTEEHRNDETTCIEEVMYGMKNERRDEAFNSLIGISGAVWQELQTEPEWQTRMTRHNAKSTTGAGLKMPL